MLAAFPLGTGCRRAPPPQAARTGQAGRVPAELRWVRPWGRPSLTLGGPGSEVGFAAEAPLAYAVSRGSSPDVRVFEVPSGLTRYYQQIRGTRDPRVSLSANGRRLAVTAVEPGAPTIKKIAVVDPHDGRPIADLRLRAETLGLTPNQTVELMGAQLRIPEVMPIDWDALALSPDGEILLAAAYGYGLHAWSVTTERHLWSVDRVSAWRTTRIVWLPGGTEVALFEAVGTASTPVIVDARTGRTVARFEPRRGHGDVSPDGNTLLGVGNGRLSVWSRTAPDPRLDLPAGESPVDVVAGALSHDATRAFVGGSSRAIREVDLGSGQVTRTFEGHLDAVSALATSPEGRYLLSGALDRTVRLWDLRTGAEAATGPVARVVLSL